MVTPPSEFDGHRQRNTIAPPRTPRGHRGHVDLDANEKLRLIYLTGQDEDSTLPPDNGEAFSGLLPREVQEELAPKPALYAEQLED